MRAAIFYQYVRFVAWFDHIIDRWTPLLCEYTESLFDKLPADKQAWEAEYWRRQGLGYDESEVTHDSP